MSQLDPELFSAWYRLGQANPWISRAWDPPFTYESVLGCYSIEELQYA